MFMYYIPECNFENLIKKLNRIKKKCEKYNCSFNYEQFDPIFKEIEGQIVKFIPIEVSGTATIDGWRFIALLEHTPKGNIISQLDMSVTLPDMYKTTSGYCDHCNTNHTRKYTCVIYNESCGLKQVGKACLKDYTGCLSAEYVAAIASGFDACEESENFGFLHSVIIPEYYPIMKYLIAVAECVYHFGYISTSEAGNTRDCAASILHYGDVQVSRDIEFKLDSVSFDMNRKESVQFATDALNWIRNDCDNPDGYYHNLKIVCADDYITAKNFGFVASLIQAYRKHLNIKKKQEVSALSDYVGTIGDAVDVDIKSASLITAFEGYYSFTRIYKFVDEDNNVYIWKTSSFIKDVDLVDHICGKVKDHTEYNGEKQTHLLRVKVHRKLLECV